MKGSSDNEMTSSSLNLYEAPKPIVCYTNTGELIIDSQARRTIFNGKDIRLTDIGFRLLWELASNEGKVISYNDLLNRIWGQQYKEEKNYFHTYIHFLRRKIEPHPNNPQHLINIPRVGYRFDSIH